MRAVGIIIKSDDKILLYKRSAQEESEQGKWENAGGKLEEGENFLQALKRELKEELDVGAEDITELLNYGGPETDNWIKVFQVKIIGTPKIMEPEYCDEIKWVNLENLKSIDLAKYSIEDFKRLGWLNA